MAKRNQIFASSGRGLGNEKTAEPSECADYKGQLERAENRLDNLSVLRGIFLSDDTPYVDAMSRHRNEIIGDITVSMNQVKNEIQWTKQAQKRAKAQKKALKKSKKGK